MVTESKERELNLDKIATSFLNRTNINKARQEIAILLQRDYLIFRNPYKAVMFYDPEKDEFYTTNFKRIVEQYIFPSIANINDIKNIKSYLDFIPITHSTTYPSLKNNKDREYFKIQDILNKAKDKQEALRGFYGC